MNLPLSSVTGYSFSYMAMNGLDEGTDKMSNVVSFYQAKYKNDGEPMFHFHPCDDLSIAAISEPDLRPDHEEVVMIMGADFANQYKGNVVKLPDANSPYAGVVYPLVAGKREGT